jgi:hypothetical protein
MNKKAKKVELFKTELSSILNSFKKDLVTVFNRIIKEKPSKLKNKP